MQVDLPHQPPPLESRPHPRHHQRSATPHTYHSRCPYYHNCPSSPPYGELRVRQPFFPSDAYTPLAEVAPPVLLPIGRRALTYFSGGCGCSRFGCVVCCVLLGGGLLVPGVLPLGGSTPRLAGQGFPRGTPDRKAGVCFWGFPLGVLPWGEGGQTQRQRGSCPPPGGGGALWPLPSPAPL